MRGRRLMGLALCAALSGAARAASFVPQGSFPVPLAATRALDRDAVGNLYVLGQAPGATTYSVASYQTQGLQPIQTFATTAVRPVAFAVEGAGSSDILDLDATAGTFFLKRYGNAGALFSQTAVPYSFTMGFSYAAALDKANQRVYLSKFWRVTPCFDLLGGCPMPPAGTQGFVYQYDFQGNLLRTITLPGNTSAAGSCYEPRVMTVDPQGNLVVADTYCQHLLRYAPTGSLLSDAAVGPGFFPTALWTDSAANVYTNQYSCSGSTCNPGIAEYSPSGALLASALTDAATSFWALDNGCAWDTRIVYTDTMGAPPLRRFVLDNAPTVPAQLVPIGAVVQHSSSAYAAWQASTDADGDPVVYTVSLGTSPASLAPVGQTGLTGLATPVLNFGTTYYWQVSAQDSYLGLPLQTSTSPVVYFVLGLSNSPPGPFAAVAGTGTAVTRDTSVTLAWTQAVDPDGDPVSYDVLWRLAAQSSATLVGTTAQTSWRMTGLAYGATYYWSVRARDVYNASSLLSGGVEQPYHLVFKDAPPPAPAVSGGAGALWEHTLSPQATLSWSSVTDPDGDAVAYRLFVGTDPASLALAQDGAGTSFNLSGAAFGTTYYWQATAYDAYASSSSPIQSLQFFLRNSPPLPFAVLAGTGTVATRAATLPLAWQTAVDPDGDAVTYDLQLATNPAGLALVQSSTATSYSLAFQFGMTYYWQVTARDGFGGATSSGLQTLLPTFRNSPPTVPVNQSATGTVAYHGFSPSLSFFWQPSVDPDGDPFVYNLFFGTDAAHLRALGSVPLGYTAANLSVNTAYYYKVVATDVYGASSDSPLNWVYYQFTNRPPLPFDVVSGTGTVATRSPSATLAWTAAVDPDGDPVTYRVWTGTSPAALSATADTTQTSFPLGSLAFGATVYWRVDAYDGYGGTTAVSGGTQSLLAIFKDSPPSVPLYLTTATVFGLHTTSPTVALAWSASSDADGDPVSYRVDVQTSTGAWPSLAAGSAASLALGLQFETTYYWRVTAFDAYAASTGPWQSLLAHFVNRPPSPFAVLSGSATVAMRETAWPLAWEAAVDPDGDAVTYDLALSTSPGPLSVVRTSTTTSFVLSFQYGTTYYWQATARDGFGGATATPVQVFRADFLDTPPPAPRLSAPFLAAPTVATMRDSVVVTWDKVSNAQGDAITYTASLGDAPGALLPVASVAQSSGTALASLRNSQSAARPSAVLTDLGSRVSLTLSGLDYYRRYYFQLDALTSYGSRSQTPLQAFNLAPAESFPRAYNYPNPFSPSRGGTRVVFNAPPSGYARATLSVYSEFGRKLYERDCGPVAPGVSQIDYDGRDQAGRALMNGSYVARLRFDGPAETATFHLLVVK